MIFENGKHIGGRVWIAELFFTRRPFRDGKDVVKMLFFKQFSIRFQILAKGYQVCIATRSLVMLIEHTLYVAKFLEIAIFSPKSNPRKT